MDTIKDIWFDANRIYMKTDGGETFSRPLEAFPLLKDASDRERLDFKIGKFGDDVRWESLDEDIHISSFFDTAEPDYENEIAMIFKRFPQLNVSEVARSMCPEWCTAAGSPQRGPARQLPEWPASFRPGWLFLQTPAQTCGHTGFAGWDWFRAW